MHPAVRPSRRRATAAEWARIVDAVVRGVDLAEDVECRLASRYALWPEGRPIWDEDGLVNPSDQMMANGVTREWTRLLRPWLSMRDFDPAVLHQLDLDAVRLLAQVHDWPVGGVVRELVTAAHRRDPTRWERLVG